MINPHKADVFRQIVDVRHILSNMFAQDILHHAHGELVRDKNKNFYFLLILNYKYTNHMHSLKTDTNQHVGDSLDEVHIVSQCL